MGTPHGSLLILVLLIAGVIDVLPARLHAAGNVWAPESTYGVIVGVLRWEQKGLTHFPVKNRKDKELYETLLKRGVPRENLLLLLDQEATKASILERIDAIAARAKPNSTLIFYYAGHGVRTTHGQTAIANYDYDPPRQAPVTVSQITETIEKNFKGARVLLFADCCLSGAFQETAQRLHKAGKAAAALTSADVGCLSTYNWTFTQTLLDGLNGHPFVDANDDDSITLPELATEVAAAMKYREGQKSGYVAYGMGEFQLASKDKSRQKIPTPTGPYAIKDYVITRDGKRERPARIVGLQDGKYEVEYIEYTERRTSFLPAALLTRMNFKTYAVGDTISVMWHEKPFDAKVVAVADDFLRITYPGWGPEWDEWVLSTRIISNDSKPANQPSLKQPSIKHQSKPLVAKGLINTNGWKLTITLTVNVEPAEATAEKWEVEWNGEWWPAKILEKTNGRIHIHYIDFDDSWNEWIDPSRLRPGSGKK